MMPDRTSSVRPSENIPSMIESSVLTVTGPPVARAESESLTKATFAVKVLQRAALTCGMSPMDLYFWAKNLPVSEVPE